MKHQKVLFLLALAATAVLSGCGGKKESGETSPSNDTTFETEEIIETESEKTLAPITPSDYLVENVSDYVKLASLDNLAATQNVYEITDELLQERIEEECYMYSEEKEVDEAAVGDTVYADVSYSVQGVEGSESSESTFFTIGDEDYGKEFDDQLVGKGSGDEFSFSVSYGDDAWYEEWADKTVDFEVTVTGAYETVVPEYDDAFVTENTEYDSKEEYEAALRETMEDEYTQEAYSETIDDLFQSVMDQSSFNGYPEDLYTSCEDEALAYYGQFLGSNDRDEILESLGLTSEDLEDEVLNSVNLRLTISAICESEELEITEDDYISEVSDSAEMYGYSGPVEYEEVNGRESIVWSLYQNKAAEYLYEHAEITPVEASAEDLYGDESYEDETEEETFGADEFYAAELETGE